MRFTYRHRPRTAAREDAPVLLQRLVSAGHLRYWIITCWALALATEVSLSHVAIWYGVTMALGLVRGLVESKARQASVQGMSSRHVVWAASVSCIAWAAAPLLAFLEGGPYGAMLAIALLGAGYTLVFTQMRAAPREALIVSLPYTAVLGVMVFGLWGTTGFNTLIAVIPVLGAALLIKVAITQIRDGEIAAAAQRQADLIVELRAARDKADAASQAKSNFLGVMSHELRTPMNGVLGAAQLLAVGDLAPQQREFVSIIQQSGASLLTLLNDILDITKIEAGKMETMIAEIAFGDLCRKVVGPFQAHAEAKGLSFTVEVDPAAPASIRTDALRLTQIVQNFLSNAIKFTGEGSIRLGVALQGPAGGDSALLCFSVQDQGVGISPEDLAKLFQPFAQVDDSSTRRFSGTGLGLSISKRLAEVMGGEVRVESTPGVGSTFSVTIRVAVEAWRETVHDLDPAEDTNPSDQPEHGLRILVAEDHPVNRLVLEAYLKPAGHVVTCATDGREALDAAQVEAFDLIIMDVNMPVMDGLASTLAIRRSDSPNRETPIVVLSASATREDHLKGFAAGADAYLNKPIDFSAVAHVLQVAPRGRASVATIGASTPGVDARDAA